QNQLAIVLESASPDHNFIELAYAWARWQLAKDIKDNSTSQTVSQRPFDPTFVEEELNSLVEEMDSSRDLKLSFSGLQTALNSTRDKVLENQLSIASRIRSLTFNIAQEKTLTASVAKKRK
ncbi:MAG: hypothetical protein EBZ87_06275, partial [Microbacteriaceae bacterium]|nr:hypothetical protein [Microbacteriaceae bacterium]